MKTSTTNGLSVERLHAYNLLDKVSSDIFMVYGNAARSGYSAMDIRCCCNCCCC